MCVCVNVCLWYCGNVVLWKCWFVDLCECDFVRFFTFLFGVLVALPGDGIVGDGRLVLGLASLKGRLEPLNVLKPLKLLAADDGVRAQAGRAARAALGTHAA